MAEANLSQSLSQNQVLTPQMRRSLDMLQANTFELSQLIQKAMEMNPVLEEIHIIENDDFQDNEISESQEEDNLNYLNVTDDDLREKSIYERASNTQSADDEERRQFLYDSIVAPQTLQQFLAEQIYQSSEPLPIKETAISLVGNLNERGFLDASATELAGLLGINPQLMSKSLRFLQSLDPPGIGATNLRESLLIQLKHISRSDSLEYTIIDKHMDELYRRQLPQIARFLSISVDRVTEAVEKIAQLNPNPGGTFSPTANPHITPDVIIKKESNGSFIAELTNDHIPQLRINDFYKDLLTKLGSDKKALDYIRENIRDGRSIISSISLRQETIIAIAQRIIERQNPFLQYGHAQLRPMTMAEVAADLGMHATTISRAVAGKFILTPHGMMEMRAFFASGYETTEGVQLSNAAVREAIQSLINTELPSKPLSDEALMKQLNQKSINIKRRTVAKYREQLHILPSHLRKR
jgi:RNA polymerase sigma-54 factor